MTPLKIALRLLAKSRSYTAVAIITLGLAIGATTAIFSVVHAVLMAPLPYKDGDALMSIGETHPSFERMAVSYPDYVDWAKGQQSFTSMGAYRPLSFNLTGGERAERVAGMRFSATLLPTLGLSPLLGRNFTADEDSKGGAPVILLSEGFWRRRFDGSPDALGKTLNLDGKAHTIVGVLPGPFLFHPKSEIFAPLAQIGVRTEQRGSHWIPSVIGRLKPGVTVAEARADMVNLSAAIGAANDNSEVRARLVPLRDDLVQDVRATLLVLMGAVVFVLLVAIANVASLSLARGAARRKEMAVRAALGAGKLRLVGLVLLESTLVALAGGAVGVLLALWGVDVLGSLRPESIPSEAVIHVDWRVVSFTVGVSVAAGLLFGLLPALQAARATDLASALKEGDQRSGTGAARTRARNALIVAEVAMALVLLVGAGLSIKAFATLSRLDPGFSTEGNAAMYFTVPPERGKDPAALRAYIERLTEKVRAVPGVASATLSSGLPIADTSETSFRDAGKPRPKRSPMATYSLVDGEFQKTLGLRLLAGRWISDGDTNHRPPVVVVDENLARTVFPGESALGKMLMIDAPLPVQIVGVVTHVAQYGPGVPEAATNQLYLPWRQVPDQNIALYLQGMAITVRAQPGVQASSLPPQVTPVVAEVDRDVPVFGAQTMQQIFDDSLGARRFTMLLLGVFAAVALILAVVGLYSVLSYLVAQRRRELGVRMALGARPGDVERMVVLQGLKLCGLGLAFGIGASLALRKVLASILTGVEPTDPVTFTAVCGVLAAAAFLATWLPARRAARVDPMIALRSE